MTSPAVHDEELISFNFWPSFADMILALVLVLCLALFIVATTLALGSVNLEQVQTNQMSMIQAIANEYRSGYREQSDGSFGIFFGANPEADIVFHNDLNSQRITFSGHLLFGSGATKFTDEGADVLRRVGLRLRSQLSMIREIQIQGHADTVAPPKGYESNVELGSARATAVFNFLQADVGIDAARHLMSVTSYGDYVSVIRSASGDISDYPEGQKDADNDSEPKKARNRRIELVVLYKR